MCRIQPTLQLLADVAGVLLLLRLVEPVYGSLETCRLLAVVNLSLGCLLVLGTYGIFIATKNAELL